MLKGRIVELQRALAAELEAYARTAGELKALAGKLEERERAAAAIDKLKPVLIRVGSTHISFWPPHVFANGWQPYDQPHAGAYLPCSFDNCRRLDVGGGAAILVYDGCSCGSHEAPK
jgi:hypothetical protein